MNQDTLGQDDCSIFKSTKIVVKMTGFFYDDTNSWILKVDQKILG